jgi:peptidoglycan/LPS O-acetylase OafA/YrhL
MDDRGVGVDMNKPAPLSVDAEHKHSGGARLAAIDSLRGVAALVVVLFHYTARFGVEHPGFDSPAFTVPWGHYGVNLFFGISGFVIFMTLQRTTRPMDFMVSRFSRLFPAYWAAIFITLMLSHLLAYPKAVGLSTALANLPMVHNFFGVPHVDGVYWTLEVELFFYAWMLLLFMLRKLDRVVLVMALALGLRWIYFVAHTQFGLDLPYRISRLMILPYLPWFVIGIAAHSLSQKGARGQGAGRMWTLLAFALVTIVVTEKRVTWWGPHPGWVACLSFAAIYLAAMGRLRFLELRPLVWLGSISYPLYLLHENLGWALMLVLYQKGLTPNVAIAIVLAIALVFSHLLSRAVERPVMRWLRGRYTAWQARQPAVGLPCQPGG